MIEDYSEYNEIVENRDEEYEAFKLNIIEKVAEHSIEHGLDSKSAADLVCFVANASKNMPLEDVVEVTGNVLLRIMELREDEEELQFILAKMNPSYQAITDEEGRLQIVMVAGQNGNST